MLKYENISVGMVVQSNCGQSATIADLISGDCYLLFENGDIIVRKTGDVRRGQFRNRDYPTVYGVGVLGEASGYSKRDLSQWRDILKRSLFVFDDKLQSYNRVGVSKDWLNFSNFFDWLFNHKAYKLQSFVIDKDILFGDTYGKEHCCLVPKEINGFFIGANMLSGVYKPKDELNYVARTTHNGKHYRIGTSPTKEGAYVLWSNEKARLLNLLLIKYKQDLDDYVIEALLNRYRLFDKMDGLYSACMDAEGLY